MEDFKSISWAEKDDNAILDYFDKLSDIESFHFLFYLLQNFPEKNIEWIEILTDITEFLVITGLSKEISEFIELYQKIFPEKYLNEYEFIELKLIDYYIFKKDKANLVNRLEIIKKNPAKGVDTVTISTLFQLIYFYFGTFDCFR